MKTSIKNMLLSLLIAPAIALAQTSPLAEGEVRKVDMEAKKITIKHGELKSLDMPPMTMVFNVKDASTMSKLKPGDKIRFKANQENGKMFVSDFEPSN